MRVVVATFTLLALVGCDGDALGPVERGARAAFQGWDMWAGEAVRPYELPMVGHPAGAVPMSRGSGQTWGCEELSALDAATRKTRAAQAYRRYCHHCHGPSGDGRTIVGESFDVELPDLRGDKIQLLSDEQIIEQLNEGSKNMISLAATLTPAEMQLAIWHIRGLVGAPSKPYFPPRYTEPITE